MIGGNVRIFAVFIMLARLKGKLLFVQCLCTLRVHLFRRVALFQIKFNSAFFFFLIEHFVIE